MFSLLFFLWCTGVFCNRSLKFDWADAQVFNLVSLIRFHWYGFASCPGANMLVLNGTTTQLPGTLAFRHVTGKDIPWGVTGINAEAGSLLALLEVCRVCIRWAIVFNFKLDLL